MDFKLTATKLWKELQQLELENRQLEKQHEALTLEHKKSTLKLGEMEYANYNSTLLFNKNLNKRKNLQANITKVTTQISKTEINRDLIEKQLKTAQVKNRELNIQLFLEEQQQLTEEFEAYIKERDELLKAIDPIIFVSSRDLASAQNVNSESINEL